MIDLRNFRLSKLNTPPYRHLLWALYWPAFGIMFALVEFLRPVEACHPVWCALDDRIPFNEWFFLPYLFWFVFLLGMHIYLGLEDPAGFRKLMQYVIVTYSFTMLIYLIYPTCQNLRPESFARDNLLTRFAAMFYAFDTNTNVCPSLHVVGAFAAAFGAWHTERFRGLGWRIAFFAMACLISVSTVFVKQHSVIDLLAGLAVSAVGYLCVYVLPARRRVPEAENA